MQGTRTFKVYKGTEFVGLIKARHHAAAHERAQALYGICDVELPPRRIKERRDYLSANTCQQAKQSRRYPVGDFEARRAALIAEVLG
jgi:hypothetical protein